jgi:MFS transporter, ACS family, tartrate transporter
MFILEAIPALIMTFAVLYYLTDRPMEAHWLEPQERQWLQTRLDRERTARERILDLSWFRAMRDWRVIALGIVYMGCNIPQYGLSFFLPQIVKAFSGHQIRFACAERAHAARKHAAARQNRWLSKTNK